MSTTAAIAFKKVRNTNPAIVLSTLRRILRGSIILGFFVGGIFALQGFGYAETYKTPQSREQFAQTLKSAPALGLMYGESDHVENAADYIVYRAVPFTAFIAGVWGLMVITKQLRGQEEDGRWEMLLSGQTTTRQAALRTLFGGLIGMLVAYIIAAALIMLTGSSPDIQISSGTALILATVVMAQAAVFMGVGILTSQLASSRRRAVLYGIIPLIALFLLRGIGNVISDAHWIKDFTPFGWIENMHIVTNFQPWWFAALAGLTLAGMAIGVYLAGKRDIGESIITESDITKPNLRLLGHQWQFSFRLMRTNLITWLLGSVALVSIIAGISSLATKATGDSAELTSALSTLAGGNNSISLAFLGMGSLFLGVILMAMMATGISGTRDEEARNYLDNIVVRPYSRIRWLVGRLVVLAAASALIILIANSIGWLIATKQGIEVSYSAMAVDSLSLLGPVYLLLSIGVLLYGLSARTSRWAAPFMYVVLAWSFIVDLLASFMDLNKIITNSSLLHYVAFIPAATPNWKNCWILVIIALVLTVVGIIAFKRRDLETE